MTRRRKFVVAHRGDGDLIGWIYFASYVPWCGLWDDDVYKMRVVRCWVVGGWGWNL